MFQIQESTVKKLNLAAAKFEDFFAGPVPEFEVSAVKRKTNVKRSFETAASPVEFEESPTHSKKALKNNIGERIESGNYKKNPCVILKLFSFINFYFNNIIQKATTVLPCWLGVLVSDALKWDSFVTT